MKNAGITSTKATSRSTCFTTFLQRLRPKLSRTPLSSLTASFNHAFPNGACASEASIRVGYRITMAIHTDPPIQPTPVTASTEAPAARPPPQPTKMSMKFASHLLPQLAATSCWSCMRRFYHCVKAKETCSKSSILLHKSASKVGITTGRLKALPDHSCLPPRRHSGDARQIEHHPTWSFAALSYISSPGSEGFPLPARFNTSLAFLTLALAARSRK